MGGGNLCCIEVLFVCALAYGNRMLLDNRTQKGNGPPKDPIPERLGHRHQTSLKAQLKQYLNQRRKGEQEAVANRLGVLSGLIVASISVGFYAIGAWNVLEQQSYNLLHYTRRELAGTPHWDDQVVVIALDDASTQTVGQYPWPRDRYVELLQTLSVAQPATVAFNVLFSESTPQDDRFAQAVVDNANVVLSVGTSSQGEYIDIAASIAEPTQGFFLKGDNGIEPDDDGISRRLWLYGGQGDPAFGIAALQVYTEVMANTVQADPSSRAHASTSDRPSQASSKAKSHSPSAFSPTAPSVAKTDPNASITHSSANSSAHSSANSLAPQPQALSEAELPSMSEQIAQISPSLTLPDDDTVWISWPGEITKHRRVNDGRSHNGLNSTLPGELKVYSYIDVVNGKVDASLFTNKIVLVGATFATHDPIRTPFHKTSPTSGVFFHAAAINNLLNESFLRRMLPWKELLLLLGIALGGNFLLRRLEASWRLVGVLGVPVLWGVIAYGSFLTGLWLPVAAPIGTLFLSALAVQLHEQQEKQQLMALFSMNVSPGTAELIWRHKGEILDQGELAAQNLTATVLFMDIRGFTSIAETLPSQKLLPWLNQYFETMTDCIMENGGMVDKYIGDAIMAVFGAPVPRTHPNEIQADAMAALQSAMEMHSRLLSLNQHLSEQNLPLIRFGIGIHTGPLVGGTVGNRHRLNYSLFGDTVNVAARIESMTKTLPESAPFSLLVSGDTRDYVKEQFSLDRVRSTQLRGRKGKIDVYTLTQLPEAIPRPQSHSDGATITPIRAKDANGHPFPHWDAS